MKLNKSNSTTCLSYYNECSNPTRVTGVKSHHYDEYLKRDESTERCHYLLSSSTSSTQSDELRANTSFSSSSCNASNKSNYSSTSSSSSLSPNECILNCLNKLSLNNETVNEKNEIEKTPSSLNFNATTNQNNETNKSNPAINDPANATTSGNSSNESSVQQETTSAQTTYNSINPIKLNSLYKIQEKIRSGGFGDVYKGIRRVDNLPIAIKIIRKERINQWFVNVSNIPSFFYDLFKSQVNLTFLSLSLERIRN